MTARVLFNTSSRSTGPWFSVSPTDIVYFSPGNLQYQASTGTWRFAEHQYDRIGASNSNISSNYSGWIDLFGWGTGNNPTTTSQNSNDYSTYNEWGNNTISGDVGTGWRTLTSEEWKYLLNDRGGDRYIKAKIHFIEEDYYIYGLIIFPDGYVHPSNREELDEGLNTPGARWTRFTKANWDAMESLGAVFLPAAGYRGYENGSLTIFNVDNEGDYWSSTVGSGTARRVMFSNSNTGDFATSNGVNPYLGYSVRLVKNAN